MGKKYQGTTRVNSHTINEGLKGKKMKEHSSKKAMERKPNNK
jgi:hypothetical protein